jgi:HAUS augmin-like complex subunit 1
MEMAEHKKDLERRTKPIADTLRSYKDLPPVCLLSFGLFFVF